jgi:branched-chain amino acid transport system ATP-binding protein
MALLEVKDIDVFYGDVQVVFGLSLRVEEGEVVSIVGGNGAGKSTLLKTISGLMQPARGEILFNGTPIQLSPPEEIVEAGIAHVPEGRRLFTLMSVKDNLIVGAYNRNARDHVKGTMEDVYSLLPRLRERESQLATTLSGGEQQMVAVGRGLMARPKLLMLDEPSLGLAPLLIKHIFDTVKQIAARGTTVLLVEQDVKHSLSLSNRGYVIEHGRVVMEGAGKELLEDPHVKTAYLGM